MLHNLISPNAPEDVRIMTGGLALFSLIVLVIITLYWKRLAYEKWRLTHKLMLIPYAVGLYHTYISSFVPLTNPAILSVWTGLTALIGLISAVYIIFFYQKVKFTRRVR